METLNNSTLLKLNKEEMECPVCHSGKMKPLNLMYEVNRNTRSQRCLLEIYEAFMKILKR